MRTKGIRILDEKYGGISVKLMDILEEIADGDKYKWSLLHFYGSGCLPEKTIPDFRREVNRSERGLFLDWKELKLLASKFFEVIDISIIGCDNMQMLIRYESDRNKYESCNYVIEMIDSGCWEVFSFDFDFIDRLSKKFKDIEFLRSDFLE